MYSSLRFALFVPAFFLLSTPVKSQGLETIKCKAAFPSGTDLVSSIYAGDGRIYLFGGYSEATQYSNAIYLYNISADTITKVGDLPTATNGNAVAVDSIGNLYHFGGYTGATHLDAIVRLNTSSNVINLVGRLPNRMNTIGTVQVKADTVLIFGLNDILEVDLTTHQVTQVGWMPDRRSNAIAWDGGDRVLLFQSNSSEHQVYSISANNETSFASPEPHSFTLHHSVISTAKSAFVVGNRGEYQGRGNGIFEVDFQTLEFTFWTVDNYPAGYDGSFYWAATTYVPELHRLYIFGGNDGSFRSEILYIDLPEENPVTTPPSPTFDCSNKSDGFYSSPYACEQYFECRGGETIELECPPPYHFNPELGVCDLPEVVKCDLDCSDKEDGLYAHWHYCSFYLRCSEGSSLVLECPFPLLFDRVQLHCNFPDIVNCSNAFTTMDKDL